MKRSTGCCNHFLSSFILAVCFSIFLQILGLGYANAADSELRAEIAADNSYVILENSQIYVKYGPFYNGFWQFAIKEFKIKSAGNENQVGTGTYHFIDAMDGRGVLESATIIYNGTDRKTVRLIWTGYNNHPVTHEVSIFGDSKYLKIDYKDIQYTFNIVDLGSPGGTMNGKHWAYGGDGWIHDYITLFNSSGEEYPNNNYYKFNVDPVDGGSLNYNNHFIMGVYNPANGRGWGRVLPIADCKVLNLLLAPYSRRGLELFPQWTPFLQPIASFTGYLYAVTGGESELESLGKQLAGGGDPQGFIDVPSGYWAEEAIYTIYDAGITKGCSQNPLKYCPEEVVTRDQMAVFLGKGIHGSNYTPPPATGIFDDVPVTRWAGDWIEQFYNDGITSGCSTNPLRYCPTNPVTRAQMAIFLLRAKHGSSYTPPAATGIFEDVPVTYWAADWIEQLYNEGITVGCGISPLSYCPEDTVTRAAMAVFLARTFGL